MTKKEEPAEAYRHIPFDLDVEQSLLGSMLRDGAHIDAAAAEITEDIFYDPLHQRLFRAIVELSNVGRVSPLILHAHVKADPGIIEVRGQEYLNAMLSVSPAIPDIKRLCAILKDLHGRRQLIQIGTDAINDAYETPDSLPVEKAIGDATARLLDLTGSYKTERTQSLGAVTAARLVLAEKRLAGEQVPRLSTGLDRLDKAMGGMQPGDHIVIAGRSGMGKTALACSIGRAVAMQAAPVLAISADMTKERWGERTLTDVDHMLRHGERAIKYGHFRGKLGQEAIAHLAEAQLMIEGWAYDICDEGEIAISRIRAKARAMANRYKGKQGVLITDFLQKIQGDHGNSRDRRRDEEITAVTYAIGDIVKDIGWTALSLAQLKNKDTDAKGKLREDPPTEADIRESGGILMAADAVLATHRKAFFIERREPAGRDFSPEPPPEWRQWEGELIPVRHDMDLIGFKNRDDSVSRLNMRLWVDMGSNAVRDHRPFGSVGTLSQTEQNAKDLLRGIT